MIVNDNLGPNGGGRDKSGNGNVDEGDDAISEDGEDDDEIQEEEVEEIEEKKKKDGKKRREGHSLKSRADRKISEI